MKIEFEDFKDKRYSIPIENVESIEPCGYNEVFVNLMDGDRYKAFGEIRFIK